MDDCILKRWQMVFLVVCYKLRKVLLTSRSRRLGLKSNDGWRRKYLFAAIGLLKNVYIFLNSGGNVRKSWIIRDDKEV